MTSVHESINAIRICVYRSLSVRIAVFYFFLLIVFLNGAIFLVLTTFQLFFHWSNILSLDDFSVIFSLEQYFLFRLFFGCHASSIIFWGFVFFEGHCADESFSSLYNP